VLYNPPQLSRFGVSRLPSISDYLVIVGLGALSEDELWPTSGLVVDRPEPRLRQGHDEIAAFLDNLELMLPFRLELAPRLQVLPF
jgi:hypothetical protein